MSPSAAPDAAAAVTLDVGGVLTLPPVGDVLGAHGIAVTTDQLLVAHHRAVAAEDAAHATRPATVDGPGDARRAYHEAFARAVGAPSDRVLSLAADLEARAARGAPWTVPAPDGREAIEAMNRVGVPVAVVSNSDGTVERQLRDMGICQTGAGPLPHVAAVVDSGVVGARKPDPAIFAPALAALGVEAGRVLHVGDTVAFDVAAARAAGLSGVHYDASGTCRGEHPHLARLADLTSLFAGRG